MHYLKCDNCGHLNEVKSEYLTFCIQCGQKFDKNFAFWKQNNPLKNFDDYLTEVCFDPDHAPSSNKEIKHFSVKRLVLRLAAIVTAILILMMIVLFGKDFIINLFNKPLDNLVGKEWTIQNCGSSGLNIETPFNLKKTNKLIRKIDPQTKKNIEQAESFEGSYGSNLFITANAVTVIPDVETSLRGAANGAIQEINARRGVTKFTYIESFIETSGLTGILQSGNYMQKGKKHRFYNAVFTKGQQSWQILIVFKASEKSGEQIAQRIINSIFIATTI